MPKVSKKEKDALSDAYDIIKDPSNLIKQLPKLKRYYDNYNVYNTTGG